MSTTLLSIKQSWGLSLFRRLHISLPQLNRSSPALFGTVARADRSGAQFPAAETVLAYLVPGRVECLQVGVACLCKFAMSHAPAAALRRLDSRVTTVGGGVRLLSDIATEPDSIQLRGFSIAVIRDSFLPFRDALADAI